LRFIHYHELSKRARAKARAGMCKCANCSDGAQQLRFIHYHELSKRARANARAGFVEVRELF